jgi:plastocyanin
MLFPFRARRARFAVLLTAACLTAVVGCSDGNGNGSSSSSTPSGAGTPSGSAPAASPSSNSKTKITIDNFTFMPAKLTVKAGATVTVTNSDTTAHTVTANTKSDFDTGAIAAGRTVTFTAPSKPGTYPYACTIHPFMKATLVVR